MENELLLFKDEYQNNKKNIMTIGKYKGMSIEEIYSVDPGYMEWIIKEDWFKAKYGNLYNLTINYFNPVKNEDSPEHNKIQIQFLNFDFRASVIRSISSYYTYDPLLSFMDEKHIWRSVYSSLLKEECPDLTVKYNSNNKKCVFEYCGFDVYFNIDLGLSDDVRNFCTSIGYIDLYPCPSYIDFFVEIKPTIGEDFPSILRQIKKQINMVEQKTKEKIELPNSIVILLYDKFTTTSVDKKEVFNFFKTNNIFFISMEELKKVKAKVLEVV